MAIMRWTSLLCAMVVLGLGFSSGAWSQEAGPAANPAAAKSEGVVSATVVTAHGKIVKVDKAKRQVTLALPSGQELTIDVHNSYNLEAAKVGTPFVARYYEVVSIRKRTPGENVPTASLKAGIATARPGGVPGAVGEVQARVLVTVNAIDETNGTVTVKAADGTVETVKARNPQNLKRIKVGDELVVTVSRAVGITLEQEAASKAS